VCSLCVRLQTSYTAQRLWDATVPVPPLATVILQFWTSTVNAHYLWLALYQVGDRGQPYALTSVGVQVRRSRRFYARPFLPRAPKLGTEMSL
jgi:hypothetical protein